MEEQQKIAFCPQCGAEVMKGARFCVFCGAKIMLADTPAPNPAPAVEPIAPVESVAAAETVASVMPTVEAVAPVPAVEPIAPVESVAAAEAMASVMPTVEAVAPAPAVEPIVPTVETVVSAPVVEPIVPVVEANASFMPSAPKQTENAEPVRVTERTPLPARTWTVKDVLYHPIINGAVLLGVAFLLFLLGFAPVLYLEAWGERARIDLSDIVQVMTKEFVPFITGVALLGYLIAVLVLLGLSCWNFGLTLWKRRKGEKVDYKLMRRPTVLLWFVFAAYPLLIYVLCHFMRASLGGSVSVFSFGVSWGLVLSMVICLLGVVFVSGKYVIGLKRRLNGRLNRKTVNAIISVSAVFLIFLASLLPCVAIKVAMPNGSGGINTAKLTVPNGAVYVPTEQEVNYLTTDVLYILCYDVADGKGVNLDGVSAFMVTFSGLGQMKGGYIALAIVHVGLQVMLYLCIALTLYTLARNLLLMEKNDKKLKKRIITLAVFAIIKFCYTVVLLIIANAIIKGGWEQMILFTISAGPIILLVGAIALIVSQHARKRLSVDTAFDNADVSYAPYVLKK